MEMHRPVSPADVRMLSLGDSYTIGESVGPSDRWPVQLAARLRAHGVCVGEPVIVARTGWTTDELDAGIDRAAVSGAYDLVTLLIGVNDQYRGRSIDEYRLQFRKLLSQAVAFAGARPERVVVLSIPDWGVTPFASNRDGAAIAAAIDAFNAVACDETHRARARFTDITPSSRRAAHDGRLTAGDGLHPSAAMYTEWVSLVVPVAMAALTGENPPGTVDEQPQRG